MADRLNASEWLLDRRVEAGDGDRVAVESGGERITYADLAGRTARAAAGLAALGVRPEERVPLVLPDGPEFVAVFLGAMRLGAVPVPLSTMLTGQELAFQCSDARARVAVVSSGLAPVAGEMAAGAAELTDLVVAGDGTVDTPVGVRCRRLADLVAGARTTASAYATWPDDLSRRLAGSHPFSVVNAGIGGNRVLTDVPNIWQGIAGIKRFNHDALTQPGVRDVILLEGINDIGNNAGPNGAPLTVQDLIGGYQNLIAQAHAAGVRIIGATMLPDQGNTYYSAPAEQVREAANDWIRTSGAFDGVIDFDKVMQDPSNPVAVNPAYDSGDHLHPNAAGMQAMADAIDLSLIK